MATLAIRIACAAFVISAAGCSGDDSRGPSANAKSNRGVPRESSELLTLDEPQVYSQLENRKLGRLLDVPLLDVQELIPEIVLTNPRLPTMISATEVLDFVKDRKFGYIGCGIGIWHGKNCSFTSHGYSKVKLPWLDDPVELYLNYLSLRQKPEYPGLVEFYGPGFRFRRFDVPGDLQLRPQASSSHQ